jgi:hypothetical protein
MITTEIVGTSAGKVRVAPLAGLTAWISALRGSPRSPLRRRSRPTPSP